MRRWISGCGEQTKQNGKAMFAERGKQKAGQRERERERTDSKKMEGEGERIVGNEPQTMGFESKGDSHGGRESWVFCGSKILLKMKKY
ncbi:hypothetical protein AVEN_216442-1 [Araneus ventricosus]|uniref:Uncharacterized protein n=1 Tax=Araneus ventricosus TaxID=182803 RepID=A0A4Y2BM99_ARAVE|nr:hypothetical protein AVEN_216442-1 [Araneus ventricosus]